MTDESILRELQQTWFRATMDGDSDTVRDLMTDDVIFLTPGRPAFGQKEFLESFNAMKEQVTLDCHGEFQEITVSGDMAYALSKLEITVTPKTGRTPKQLSGKTLSIYRRSADGTWRLCRDANFVRPDLE